WKGWYIKREVLYNETLSTKYYNWEASDLMLWVFYRANPHLKPERREAERAGILATTAGGSDDAPTRRLRGARAPAFHLPGSVAAIAVGNQRKGSSEAPEAPGRPMAPVVEEAEPCMRGAGL